MINRLRLSLAIIDIAKLEDDLPKQRIRILGKNHHLVGRVGEATSAAQPQFSNHGFLCSNCSNSLALFFSLLFVVVVLGIGREAGRERRRRNKKERENQRRRARDREGGKRVERERESREN